MYDLTETLLTRAELEGGVERSGISRGGNLLFLSYDVPLFSFSSLYARCPKQGQYSRLPQDSHEHQDARPSLVREGVGTVCPSRHLSQVGDSLDSQTFSTGFEVSHISTSLDLSLYMMTSFEPYGTGRAVKGCSSWHTRIVKCEACVCCCRCLELVLLTHILQYNYSQAAQTTLTGFI